MGLEESGSLTSDYKATIIKTLWYWNKNRNIDQWNSIESPEINPCTYGHLIYDKGGKNVQWKKTVSAINGALGVLDSYLQKHQTGLLFHTMHKINSKSIKHLNVNPEITKLLKLKS